MCWAHSTAPPVCALSGLFSSFGPSSPRISVDLPPNFPREPQNVRQQAWVAPFLWSKRMVYIISRCIARIRKGELLISRRTPPLWNSLTTFFINAPNLSPCPCFSILVMALTKKKKGGNAHGKKRGPKKAPQGEMSTADATQRQSAVSLENYRIKMKKTEANARHAPPAAARSSRCSPR